MTTCSPPRLRFGSCVLVLLASSLGVVAAPPIRIPTAPELTTEEKAQVDAVATPEQLVDMAKNSFSTTPSVATAAIQKACRLKPELLTDGKSVSPTPWNEFWFTQRGAIRESTLARDDAAGRLDLARWMAKAGASTAAAQMVAKAQTLKKDLPEAAEIMKTYNLSPPAPVRFDFSFGLSQPLIRTSFMDEGVDMLLPTGREILVIPLWYDASDTKLSFSSGVVKATGDDGKICPCRGVWLLKPTTSGDPNAAGAGRVMQFEVPAPTEPLYEKVQVQLKADKSGTGLSVFNPRKSPARPEKRAPGAPPPPRNTGPRERPPVAPRPPAGMRNPSEPRTETLVEPTGYLALVFDIPQTLQSITLEYRGAAPLKVERAFLESLQGFASGDRDTVIKRMIEASRSPEGPVARAALARLFLSVPAGGTNQPSPEVQAGLAPPPAYPSIYQALIAGVSHADGPTRQFAADLLLRSGDALAPQLLEAIRKSPAPAAGALVGAIRARLNQPLPEGAPQPPADQSDPIAQHAVEHLPSSAAPRPLFEAAIQCLAHGDSGVRSGAIQMLIADGSQQAVLALSKASGPARDALASQLAGIQDPELKAAILRVLLMKVEPGSAGKLLAACTSLAPVITQEDDPLITALRPSMPPDALQGLLELLGRADMGKVSQSDKFSKQLEDLSLPAQKNPGVRKALMSLAMGQVTRQPYQAPLRMTGHQQGDNRQGLVFETLLASMLADKSAGATAMTALIASGRLTRLNEKFTQLPPERRRELVDAVCKDKSLWPRESLFTFLATRVGEQNADAETQQKALAWLGTILQRSDRANRWRANLAIKQGIESTQLIELSANTDETISKAATELLRDLSAMSTSDSNEFMNAADKAARESKLNDVESKRSARPVGSFMAVVYFDLKAPDQQPQPPQPTDAAPASAPAAPPPPRTNFPLQAGPVTAQPAGPSAVQIIAKDVELQSSASGGQQQGGIRINAAPLLQAALESEAAANAGLAGAIDLNALSSKWEVELKYDRLGTWSAEVTPPSEGQASAPAPLRIERARLFLEPLPR